MHLLEVLRRLPLTVGHFPSADGVEAGPDGELFMGGTGDWPGFPGRAVEGGCRYLDPGPALLGSAKIADLDVLGFVQQDFLLAVSGRGSSRGSRARTRRSRSACSKGIAVGLRWESRSGG